MTANPAISAPNQSSLCWAIARRICRDPQHRISFAEFMEMALYHPQWGYYNRRLQGRSPIGSRGDFVTAPHMGSDFGELLATQFVEMWHRLGCPRPFHIVEMGAGQGLIVRDVLNYLHRHYFDCFEAVDYIIVEQSTALIVEQKRQLAALPSLAAAQARVQWCSWDDLEPDSITGCIFSNELIDAFPVHQVIAAGGKLQEVYVTLQQIDSVEARLRQAETSEAPEGQGKLSEEPSREFVPDETGPQETGPQETGPQFMETVGELSTPRLQAYFARLEIDLCAEPYPDNYRTEVNLQALDWLAQVAQWLHRGYVLTIDYGYPALRLYSPARSQGTLQCYYQHAHHSNPYIYVGQQDITAHVDFTTLERQGEPWGLQNLAMTQQAMFLMALGLGDRIAALSYAAVDSPSRDAEGTLQNTADAAAAAMAVESMAVEPMSMNDLLRRREALHALMNPMGMGNFQVLLQGKGLAAADQAQPLKGFDIPPL